MFVIFYVPFQQLDTPKISCPLTPNCDGQIRFEVTRNDRAYAYPRVRCSRCRKSVPREDRAALPGFFDFLQHRGMHQHLEWYRKVEESQRMLTQNGLPAWTHNGLATLGLQSIDSVSEGQ